MNITERVKKFIENTYINLAARPKDQEEIKHLQSVLDQQHAVGLAEYGKTLDDADLSVSEVYQHLLEEIADALCYTEKLTDIDPKAKNLVGPDLSDVKRVLTQAAKFVCGLKSGYEKENTGAGSHSSDDVAPVREKQYPELKQSGGPK